MAKKGSKKQSKKEEETEKPGRLNLAKMGKLINKKAGQALAYNLEEENPTLIPYWISTGSRWLDSIICNGSMAGIPANKVTEIAGLSSCVTEDTLVEIVVEEGENKQTVKISEIRKLLSEGKKVKVKTLDGEYTNVSKYIEKGVLPTYEVELKNGKKIKTSEDHRFFSSVGWLKTKNLKINQSKLLCEDGTYSTVKSVEFVGKHPIVDITVDHPEHCYFGNGILNHNSGKSYLAAEIGVKAQLDHDMDLVWFDSENAIDTEFLRQKGCDLNRLLYVQALNVEFVLETIEQIIANKHREQRVLFVWDSLALTTCVADQEGDMNPNSSIGVKARILSKGIAKLQIPMANSNCTLLVLNQLKDNISSNKYKMMSEPYFTPGGKTLPYSYHLRIWLTSPEAKAHGVYEDEIQIGSKVKAKIKKSRLGTKNRSCEFQILWGGSHNRICDEESWLDAIKTSPYYKGGQKRTLIYADGTEERFFESHWLKHLENKKFRKRVLELMDEELIHKHARHKNNEEEEEVF